MKKIIVAISALLCAASGLHGQEFNYDMVSAPRVNTLSEVNAVAKSMVGKHADELRFFITTGGLNAMMDLYGYSPDAINFALDEFDSEFVGNCISIKQVKSLQDGIVKDLLCDWTKGDMSKDFYFRLVSNKGILIDSVIYSFSPEELYNALKDKYGK